MSSKEQANEDVIFVTSVVCTGLLCLFGFIGNVLALVALCKESHKSSNVYLLSALCVADWFMLVSLFNGVVLIRFSTYFDLDYYLLSWDANTAIRVIWVFGCIIQTCAIWLVVAVTCDRFVAVCWPLRRRTLNSSTRAKYLITAVVLFSIMFNIPRFFHYTELDNHSGDLHGQNYTLGCNNSMLSQNTTEINKPPRHVLFHQSYSVDTSLNKGTNLECINGSNNAGHGNELRHNVWYHYVYYITLSWLVLYIIPLASLLVLNVLLFRQIKQAQGNHVRLARNPKEQENLSVTINIVAIVTIFIICQTPDFIHTLISYPAFGVEQKTQRYMSSAAHAFLALNSSVNFIVYCLFYRRFRKTVLYMFCRWHPNVKHKIGHEMSVTNVNSQPKKYMSSNTNLCSDVGRGKVTDNEVKMNLLAK